MLVRRLFGQFTPKPEYAVWFSKPPAAIVISPPNPDGCHTVGGARWWWISGQRCTVMHGVITTCCTSLPWTWSLPSTCWNPKWVVIISPFLANSAGKIKSSSFRIMIDVATTCQYGTRIMTIVDRSCTIMRSTFDIVKQKCFIVHDTNQNTWHILKEYFAHLSEAFPFSTHHVTF